MCLIIISKNDNSNLILKYEQTVFSCLCVKLGGTKSHLDPQHGLWIQALWLRFTLFHFGAAHGEKLQAGSTYKSTIKKKEVYKVWVHSNWTEKYVWET